MRPKCCLAAVVLLTALLVGGCSTGTDGFKPDPNGGKTLAQRQDEQIKTIESNPNMPEDAKKMAIAAVKGSGHQTRR